MPPLFNDTEAATSDPLSGQGMRLEGLAILGKICRTARNWRPSEYQGRKSLAIARRRATDIDPAVDNFEGLAIDPRSDGRLNVWLISGDNSSELQRNLVWKLIVDPADLPGSRSQARRDAARPSTSSN